MREKIRIVKTFDEALKKREIRGIRFDNSNYWEKYYLGKLKDKDISREKNYANFFSKVCKGGKVLDLATGYGFLPVEMKKLGFEVTGLDRFDEMIDLAKKYFRENKVDIKIVKSDVINTPFESGQFDVVTAMSIMEHLSEDEVKLDFIPEIRRVLRKRGYVLIHVPVKSCVTLAKKWFRKNIVKDLPCWAIDDDGDVTHKMWMSFDEYFDLLDKNGLKVKYVGFNFSRSNERIWWMRWLSVMLKKIDGEFYRFSAENKSLAVKIFVNLCSSVDYVCEL